MQRANWILKQRREAKYKSQKKHLFTIIFSTNKQKCSKLICLRRGIMGGRGCEIILRLSSDTCQFIIIRKTCQFLLSNTSVYNSKINLGFVIHGVSCFKYLHAHHNFTNYGMYALKRVITTT